MYWDVVEVKPIGHLNLQVRFVDGLSGRVSFVEGGLRGIFTALKDPVFFNQVRISDGFVTWPGELDLAPDAMYHAIKEQGEWRIT